MNRISSVIVICLFLTGLPLTNAAWSQQAIGLKGLGGRLSFVEPEHVGGTIGLGGHADLGEIIQNLHLFPSIEYWGKSSVSQVAINGDVRYYFPAHGTIDFFAGGGLVIAFNSFDLLNASDSAVGLNFLGGLDYPVSENMVFPAEVKYLASDLAAFKITGGVTVLLGR